MHQLMIIDCFCLFKVLVSILFVTNQFNFWQFYFFNSKMTQHVLKWTWNKFHRYYYLRDEMYRLLLASIEMLYLSFCATVESNVNGNNRNYHRSQTLSQSTNHGSTGQVKSLHRSSVELKMALEVFLLYVTFMFYTTFKHCYAIYLSIIQRKSKRSFKLVDLFVRFNSFPCSGNIHS